MSEMTGERRTEVAARLGKIMSAIGDLCDAEFGCGEWNSDDEEPYDAYASRAVQALDALTAAIDERVSQVERERESAVADAERWRRLTGCARVRVIGSARLGQPDAHIGVEFWGKYRGATPEQSADSVADLTRYVDGLAASADVKVGIEVGKDARAGCT